MLSQSRLRGRLVRDTTRWRCALTAIMGGALTAQAVKVRYGTGHELSKHTSIGAKTGQHASMNRLHQPVLAKRVRTFDGGSPLPTSISGRPVFSNPHVTALPTRWVFCRHESGEQ